MGISRDFLISGCVLGDGSLPWKQNRACVLYIELCHVCFSLTLICELASYYLLLIWVRCFIDKFQREIERDRIWDLGMGSTM